MKRVDAIATGVLVMALGGGLLAFTSGSFLEDLKQAQRQQQTTGKVVGQQATKVCQNTGRTFPLRCERRITQKCPVVQYKPASGKSLKKVDCSLSAKTGERVYVVYDSATPTDARVSFSEGSSYDWFFVGASGLPVVFAGFIMATGLFSLCRGIWGFKHSETT